MIVIRPNTPNLEQRAYLSGKRTSITSRSTATINSASCALELFNCDFPVPQFVDLEDRTDKFKNDFFSFAFEKDGDQVATVTVTNCLTDDIVIINDDTYGEFWDFGDFPLRPDVCVFYIDWYEFVSANGFGSWTIKVELSIEGIVISTPLNRCFEVMPFSYESAHGTIRFETLQTGYIHNGFDYRNLKYHFGLPWIYTRAGFLSQIRWYGRMFKDVPIEEDDFIQMSSRIETQIQQKVTNKYKIELYHIKSDLGEKLMSDNFLATKILVSDYNMNNYEVYRNKFLRKLSTDEVGIIRLNSGANPIFTFKEMDEGTLKRVWG